MNLKKLLYPLCRSHTITKSNQEALEISKALLELELEQKIIKDCIVLQYDFINSEQIFNGSYHLLTSAALPLIEDLAYQFGFRWRSSIRGDGAILCLGAKFDKNNPLTSLQTIINASHFALELNHLFNFSPKMPDNGFILDQINQGRKKFNKIKQIVSQHGVQNCLIKIGFAYGSVKFTNYLSTIINANEQKSLSVVEACRLVHSNCGPFLAKNSQIKQIFKKNSIKSNQFISLLSPSKNLFLLKFNKIPSKKNFYSGWKVIKDSTFNQKNVNKINQLVKQILGWSEHNHFEGNYQPKNWHLNKNKIPMSLSLKTFIEQIPTHILQKKSLTKNKSELKKYIQKVTLNIISSLKQQGIRHGFLFISPYNLARDPLQRSDLIRKKFKPLTMRQYLKIVHQTLKQADLDLKLIISLRRDKVEKWYFDNSHKKGTDKILKYFKKLKKENLIGGIDICGIETKKSVAASSDFLQKLKRANLLHSIHAGEVQLDDLFLGLLNIIQAIQFGADRIGHGLALWYFLDTIRDSKTKQRVLKFIKQSQVIFQVCLISNIFTCVNQATSGKKLSTNNIIKRMRRHPFVELLIKEGPNILTTLPKITLSSDDYVVTKFNLEEELQILTYVLLQNGWNLTDILNLFTHFAATTKNRHKKIT